MRKSKIKTELVAYMCPKCKSFNKPYFHNKKGIAFTRCTNCKAQYKTSTARSAKFRKFSSRHGRKPNRQPNYYSSSERAGKKYLENLGLKEGFDFFHNARVKTENAKGRIIYYWLDFVIPSKNLVIEISPEIWHKLSGVPEKDKRKRKFIEDMGWTLIDLKSEDIKLLNRTKLGSDKRPALCKKLDGMFKKWKPKKNS